MSRMPSAHARQRGAALIVGLIMLVVLTLLAVTTVNTSSTELIMAGNEQYRERAFHAAEVGIEQSLRRLSTVPQTGAPVALNDQVPSLPDDHFETTIRFVGEDQDIPGFSAGKFVGLHYRVESTGHSARNSRSVQEQGAYILGAGPAAQGTTPWLPGAAAP